MGICAPHTFAGHPRSRESPRECAPDTGSAGTTTSANGDITVTANSGDIQLGRLNAGSGRLTINAVTGAVIGDISPITDPNLRSQTLEILLKVSR